MVDNALKMCIDKMYLSKSKSFFIMKIHTLKEWLVLFENDVYCLIMVIGLYMKILNN